MADRKVARTTTTVSFDLYLPYLLTWPSLYITHCESQYSHICTTSKHANNNAEIYSNIFEYLSSFYTLTHSQTNIFWPRAIADYYMAVSRQ